MSITPIFGWDNLEGGRVLEPELLGVTFWPRVAARLIDMAAHYVIRYATGWLFGVMLAIASQGHVSRLVIAKLRHPGLTVFAFGLLGWIAYHVIFTTVHGSSMGKRILGMVVVQEDGSPCKLKSAVVRELAYVIDALFFGIIAYTAMQNDPKEQRHGDEWAKTIVCKRSQVSPENLRGPERFVVASVFALAADAAFVMTGLLVVIAI
jgi:uncharacterized RDD family membrane protein YckC